MQETMDNTMSLHHRLNTLRLERRELDAAIQVLCLTPSDDELVLHRLKKRKRILRDRIALIESILNTDTPA